MGAGVGAGSGAELPPPPPPQAVMKATTINNKKFLKILATTNVKKKDSFCIQNKIILYIKLIRMYSYQMLENHQLCSAK